MEYEIITVETTETPQAGLQPMALAKLQPAQNSAALQIEIERAKAEVVVFVQAAKMCPRDEEAARKKILQACQSPTLAQRASYSVPRGNENAKGPSIHLAKEIARCWGNLQYGIIEHAGAADGASSEWEAVCWDLEGNTRAFQRFTVKHFKDTKSGGYKLTKQQEIFEHAQNIGSKRLRSVILSNVPGYIVDEARSACAATVRASVKDLEGTKTKMLAAYKKFGVSQSSLASYLRKDWNKIDLEDVVELREIYEAIADKVNTAAEFFGASVGKVDDQGEPAAEAKGMQKAGKKDKQEQKQAEESKPDPAPDAGVTVSTKAPEPEPAPAAPPPKEPEVKKQVAAVPAGAASGTGETGGDIW